MKSREHIEELILRLLEGEELPKNEQSSLLTWLKEHPEEQKPLSEQIGVWINLDTDRELSDELIDEQWQEFHKNIIQKTSKVQTLKPNLKVLPVLIRYAAIFVFGLIVASASSYLYRNYFDTNYTVQTVKVPLGAKSVIMLTDGTEVILNAGSKLEYTSLFNRNTREVSLDGEAYFKVRKNAKKPFTVKTAGLVVKAYGTEFNVKSYADDKTIEATLIEGLIGVRKNTPNMGTKPREFMLKPMDQVILHKADSISKNGKLFIAKNVDTDLYTSWINDKVQVKSESLKDLVVKLERKYNVKINIEDKELEDKKFTGILENETIEQVLQVLKLSAHINYKIEEREIWLYH